MYDKWAQAMHTLPETTSKLRPRPLSEKIICAPARHSRHKAAMHTKFEVSSSSSFRDIAL